MNDRTVIIHDEPVIRDTRIVEDGSSNALVFGIIAVIAIVIIGLFVWQPWNASSTSTTTNVTTNAPPADNGNASSTTTSNGTTNSSTTTTTTNP